MKKALSLIVTVLLLLFVCVPAFAATVPANNEGGVLIDGTKDSSYGDTPVKTVKYVATEDDPSSLFWIFKQDAPDVDYGAVQQDIYLSHDADYLYVYAVVTGWNWSKQDTTFAVLVASVEDAEGTPTVRFEWEGNQYENCARLTFAQFEDGSHLMSYEQCGIGERDLLNYGTDYTFAYLTGNRMAYEVRIPWGHVPSTNGHFANHFAISTYTKLSSYGADPATLLWYQGSSAALGPDMDSLNEITDRIELGTDSNVYVEVTPEATAEPAPTIAPTEKPEKTEKPQKTEKPVSSAAETTTKGGNVILYVILGVIAVAIVVIVIFLLKGKKKTE